MSNQSTTAVKPVIVVHGGAGNIPDHVRPLHRSGLEQALAAGWAILEEGGTAMNAALAAVKVMEDLPQFNAGLGSALTRTGEVEMDAGLMDGRTLDVGAVAAVRRVANPILLARLVLERSPHILMACEGAEAFAQSEGMSLVPPESLITEERRRRLQTLLNEGVGDTVGAVALDVHGNIVAATSTGGMMGKLPGRVGDSPLVGCGFYADNALGGCSTTGIGETIARALLAHRAVHGLRGERLPQEAAEAAIAYLKDRIGGEAGLILLDRHGRVGAAWNTRRMSYGYVSHSERFLHT